jgi:hypothetical protein
VKRTFISVVAILAFAAAARADELSDIQAQARQLREQNAAMAKRLAEIEKRQKVLETQQKAAAPVINPVDAMAADLPYKAAAKPKPAENDDICIKGICVYGNFDMGVSYIQHGAPVNAIANPPLNYLISKNSNGAYFGAGANQFTTSFIGLDARIFKPEPMGLRDDMLRMPFEARFDYDDEHNILFLNFENLEVKTIDIVNAAKDRIRAIVEPLGHKVYAVVNYDGFVLDRDVEDAYLDGVQEMGERYFHGVTRFTTSAFMHAKLGETLTKRGVAPHIFESEEEAKAAVRERVPRE